MHLIYMVFFRRLKHKHAAKQSAMPSSRTNYQAWAIEKIVFFSNFKAQQNILTLFFLTSALHIDCFFSLLLAVSKHE